MELSSGRLEIDLGAEQLIAAQKDNILIAVEVKSFLSPSTTSEFHLGLGQFLISPDFYSSPTFTYRVELLEKAEESSTKSIPEPSAIFGLLTLGICGLVKGKK